MGKVRSIQIVYDRDDGRNVNVFSQGEVINGRVVIQVETEDQQELKHVQGMYVSVARTTGPCHTGGVVGANKYISKIEIC